MTEEEEYEEDFSPSSPKKQLGGSTSNSNSYPTVELLTIASNWSSIPRSNTPASNMPSACAALEQLSQAVHIGFTSSQSLLVSASPGAVKSYKSLSNISGTPKVRGNKLRLLPELEDPLTLQDEEAAIAALALTNEGDVDDELLRRKSALKSRPSGKKYTSASDGADIKGPPTMVNNSSEDTSSGRRGREIRFQNKERDVNEGRRRDEQEDEEERNNENAYNDEYFSHRNTRNSDPTPSRNVYYENDVQEDIKKSSSSASSSSFADQQARRARLATSLLRNKISDVPPVPKTLQSKVSSSSSTLKRSSMKGSRSQTHGMESGDGKGEEHDGRKSAAPHHSHQTPRIATFNEAMRSKTYSRNNSSYSSSSTTTSSANGHGVGLAPPSYNPTPPYGFGGTVDGSISANRFSSSNGASLFFSGSVPLPVLVGSSNVSRSSDAITKTMYLWDHPPPGMAPLLSSSTPSGGSPTRDGSPSSDILPPYLPSNNYHHLRRPSLSDDVLLQLFLLSQYKGQTKEEQRIEELRRKAARDSGLVVSAPHVPLSVLSDGATSAKTFANSLKNEQAVLLLRHGSGGSGSGAKEGENSHIKQQQSSSSSSSSSSLDAPVNPSVLAALWGGVFDRLFSHVVLNLPRLVAEASLSCSAAIDKEENEEEEENEDEDDNDDERSKKKMNRNKQASTSTHTTPLPLPLSLAVGHPILTSLQDMLTDVDVLTLVREAVAAKIQQRLSPSVPSPFPPQSSTDATSTVTNSDSIAANAAMATTTSEIAIPNVVAM